MAHTLESLYATYHESLVRMLYRRTGDRDRAEDLAQEVFTAPWPRRLTTRGPGCLRLRSTWCVMTGDALFARGGGSSSSRRKAPRLRPGRTTIMRRSNRFARFARHWTR